MAYSSTRSLPVLPTAILASVFSLGIALSLTSLTSTAAAYDDDVDVVCWDRHDGETECQTIAELTAECALVDPEYTTEQCGGLLENRVPVGLRLTTKDKPHRDDNGGKGQRDPNGGGNNGGGSSAGGDPNSGGSSGSGPNG